MLRLSNTLSGKLEEFQTLEPKLVKMYSCGPTVYDYGHIGNFRTFLFVDLLRRFLKQSGYKLDHVMNITDVDDKIIRNAAQQKKTVREYAQKYEDAFLEDCKLLNLERPEHVVRATEHIDGMAEFIAALEMQDIAYKTADGSYYFRIAKFPEYGKLSKKDFAGMEVGARVDVDEYDKESATDFALWKAPKPGEESWQTKIGPGRPGWHIECSVMAREYLGDTFDMHLGGEDLVFPHHENEIAQTESLTHKPMARYWVHCRFLLVEGEKMSKKLGNFYTLRDLMLMGHKASSIRFLLASVPFTKQLNFTFDGLKQATQSVERLRNLKSRLESAKLPAGSNPKLQEAAVTARKQMTEGLADDMNTAVAMAGIFDLVRETNIAADNGELRQDDVAPIQAALNQFDEIFDVLRDDDAEKTRFAYQWAKSAGVAFDAKVGMQVEAEILYGDEHIKQLVEERNRAKQARDFRRSDEIRDELAKAGVILEDTKDGVRWKRK